MRLNQNAVQFPIRQRFVIKAAVVHVGNYANAGHYVAVVRAEDGFRLMDDGAVSSRAKSAPQPAH